MSGGQFPFIYALLGLIDAILGVIFFLAKLAMWLFIPVVLALMIF